MPCALDGIMASCNRLAEIYPDACDPTKPLPATALVAYAYHLHQMCLLNEEVCSSS